ncbi:hypothetical protein [Bosea sp. RAC05]|uniref:hypothetical protein n=1 Tax=Bosea sp. RAC05 TaxID=1842539 RepID=UPI00083DD235|nr:hypothetical protein [Bosea sp. RAC05]AOG03284.1 hypothetical protein BSY19_5424 [Bosea sp. RAC05]
MKTELELDDGKWLELETAEDGRMVDKIGETFISVWFNHELKLRRRPKPGFSPSRFFAFQTHSGEMPVMMGIGESHGMLANNGKHIAGFRNQDPFPAYASHVEAMGKHLGIELDERHYFASRRSRRDDEPTSPSP